MSDDLRVALFSDSSVFAGTERHIFDLAVGLRAAGMDLRLVCPSPSALAARARDAALPMETFKKSRLADAAALRTLVGLLRRGVVDLVHSHNGRTALLAAVAVKLAGRGCAVTTQHFLDPAHVSRRGIKALVSRMAHRWVNRQMHRFITISSAAKAGMLARGQATSERISLVPNGMPSPDLGLLATPQAIRAELGIDPRAVMIVSVARLEPEKSLETLIAAMKEVAVAEPSAVCVIAGDGKQKAALLAQISSSGLDGRVKLLGFRGDPLALMHAGDLFILPSAVESFGLVLIEAMSLGRPVIATRAGGPLEVVAEEATGLLVPPSAAAPMAAAILTLVRDPHLRRRMGEAGRLRFLERYTVDRMILGTRAAYAEALAGSTRARGVARSLPPTQTFPGPG